MTRRRARSLALVGLSALVVVGVLAVLLADLGHSYPGFFYSVDYRVFPVTARARAAGLAYGDRIVSVDGASPLTLRDRARAGGAPIRYEVEREGRRFTVVLGPARFTWAVFTANFAGYFVVSAIMLVVGVLVYAQNPAAAPNRNFLIYMCLWSVSNVAIPEAVLGPDKYSGAIVGLAGTLLPVHGWVFFLTYPANRRREAWLRRHRVIPILYAVGAGVGIVTTLTFSALFLAVPEVLARGPLYGITRDLNFALATVSFPIKIACLLDTRRRAASPLVNQQTTVLLLGIGLGLGLWILLMLAPLLQYYPPPVDLQLGSAFVLIYPLAIAYATVRYRLFDATVVIRRSVVYTALAGVIAGTYALTLAGANALLAQAELARSPAFSAAVIFALVLVVSPLRARVQRTVDRTFFRERYDYAAAIQTVARSLAGLLDLDEIRRRVTTTVESVMHARMVQLTVGTAPPALAPALAAAPGALSRYQLDADPTFAEIAAPALEVYRDLGAEVVVPLRFQDDVRALLIVGPKRAEAPYTAEDLALLETLADQSAVAVANASAHRQVVEYARQLERSLLIRTNLAKFVPQRVRQLIEESPEAPSLDKRETEVSVLFADITGYTRLSSRLAGEELDALVERYFGAFLDEIVKHGGDVNETAGDGLMVLFHENDHPRAAVEAALAIHRRTAELNGELAGRFEPLAMHIGINTGPALLGATKIEGRAGTRWTYTASGLTTNIAARLAAVAEGGDIVISESTRRRLPSELPVEDIGTRALKNVDAPQRVFRLRS
jgi:class 3 adenylate cyclase